MELTKKEEAQIMLILAKKLLEQNLITKDDFYAIEVRINA